MADTALPRMSALIWAAAPIPDVSLTLGFILRFLSAAALVVLTDFCFENSLV